MEITKKVKRLMNIKQPEQRSNEWFKMRENKITASSAASLLIKDEKTCRAYVEEFRHKGVSDNFIDNKPANPYSSKKDYILTKCGINKFTGSVATYWGTMLEQVASNLYSKRESKNVIEFGLLQHNNISFLAASPDGISPKGIMVEIKCPFRRKITGIPPFYYWVQMQLQLEVTNLTKCDFLECSFVEIKTEEEYDNMIIRDDEEKGIFIEMRPMNKNDRSESKYYYPKIYEDDLKEWRNNKIEILEKKYKDEYKIFPVYWKLVDYSVVRVYRSKEWFANVIDILEKGWKEVQYYKENGCDELIKMKKIKKDNIMILDDIKWDDNKNDEDYMIISDDSDEE